MSILRRQSGTRHDLGKNPLMAMMAAQMFAGRRFHRGLPPAYASIKSDQFEALDAVNRQHVESVLQHTADRLKCSVSDLAWAIAPQTNAAGLHPVLVKKWEEIERQEWLRKKEGS